MDRNLNFALCVTNITNIKEKISLSQNLVKAVSTIKV